MQEPHSHTWDEARHVEYNLTHRRNEHGLLDDSHDCEVCSECNLFKCEMAP